MVIVVHLLFVRPAADSSRWVVPSWLVALIGEDGEEVLEFQEVQQGNPEPSSRGSTRRLADTSRKRPAPANLGLIAWQGRPLTSP